jgi:hypothetical protein
MIPTACCEFCGADVAVRDAVIFGPDPKTDDEWEDLARRFLRQDPELELVFLHHGCDVLIDQGGR